MPIHNFMFEDLCGVGKAICLFPLFLLVPGYAVAWLLDLLEFRRRTVGFRVALSIPLSIGLCQILTYWLGRFAGFAAVWAFYGAGAAVFLIVLAVDFRRGTLRRPWWPARSGIFAVIVCVWLAVSVLSLIDVQVGDRLYYPVSTVDYALRTSLLHSISTTGVPPANPFFLPEHPVPLRYHYFWPMMCSLVQQISVQQTSGAAVSARQAMVGGTFWAGIGLMALLVIYLRVFLPGSAEQFRRRALGSLLVLGITGLDLAPSLFFLMLYVKGIVGFVLPSVEAWNEPVHWFVYATLWVPHAVAAATASFLGFLLIWQCPETKRRRDLVRYAVPGGMALASAVGCSIFVALVFALFLALWTGVTIWKKWYRETAGLMVAGAAMIALAIPYLTSLKGAGEGKPIFQLTVRAFSLAAVVPTHGLSSGWRAILVNGPLLPLNYLLEFGFFFLVALYKWRQHRASGLPASRAGLAGTLMLATSVVVCTFVRSTGGFNDLGWRGMLVAEVVLVIWAADFFPGWPQRGFVNAPQRALLTIFLTLGAAGTIYDLAIERAYPMLADRGKIPPMDWMSSDRDFGRRTYAARTAYEWLKRATPETAAVQGNPHVMFQDTLGMLYSDRHMVAEDTACMVSLGGEARECAPLLSLFEGTFPGAGHTAASSIQEVCAGAPVDVLVAKDTDRAWADRESWVWRERPAYANAYVRMFRCGVRTAAR